MLSDVDRCRHRPRRRALSTIAHRALRPQRADSTRSSISRHAADPGAPRARPLRSFPPRPARVFTCGSATSTSIAVASSATGTRWNCFMKRACWGDALGGRSVASWSRPAADRALRRRPPAAWSRSDTALRQRRREQARRFLPCNQRAAGRQPVPWPAAPTAAVRRHRFRCSALPCGGVGDCVHVAPVDPRDFSMIAPSAHPNPRVGGTCATTAENPASRSRGAS